jgi:hypothetical protein
MPGEQERSVLMRFGPLFLVGQYSIGQAIMYCQW